MARSRVCYICVLAGLLAAVSDLESLHDRRDVRLDVRLPSDEIVGLLRGSVAAGTNMVVGVAGVGTTPIAAVAVPGGRGD